jgi:hypothetical protein
MLDELHDTCETHSWHTLLLFGAGLVSEQVVCIFLWQLWGGCHARYQKSKAKKKPIFIFALFEAIADAYSVPTHQSDLDLEL